MIQNVSSMAASAALATASKVAIKQAAPVAAAAAQNTVTKKAVPALSELNAQAYLQRQEIGAALYDRSFTLGEGARMLKRQEAIATYAEQIQMQEGGPTAQQLRKLGRMLDRAEGRIQALSNNDKGANLSSIAGIDGKELDTVQDNLAARIQHGIKDGSLTAEEAADLLARQQEIGDVETKLRASDGKLTAGEQKQLLDELRKTADDINRARSNGVGTNVGNYDYGVDVDRRQADLIKQLEQGVKLGSLTAEEAEQVMAEFDKVNTLELVARANGRVDWREATGLSSAMNSAEIKLYDLQRNADGVKLADTFVDVKYVDQREAQQLESITRGLDNGALTNDEGVVLLRDQQSIQALEDKLVNGGLTRGEYLRLQTEMNDFSLMNADLQSNRDRFTGIIPPPSSGGSTGTPPAGSGPSAGSGTPATPPSSGGSTGTPPAGSGPSAGSGTPATPPASDTSAPPPVSSAPVPTKPEEPAAPADTDQKSAEVAPEANIRLPRGEEARNRFAELMTAAMRTFTDDVREFHGKALDAAAERRHEAQKAQDDRKSDDKHVSRESDRSGWVTLDKGLDFGARNADRDAKVGAYVSAAASTAPRAEPAIARKVA